MRNVSLIIISMEQSGILLIQKVMTES